jgi:hypothetical protein
MIYPVDPERALSYEHFWGMNHVISRLVMQNPRRATLSAVEPPANVRPAIGLFAAENLEHVTKEELAFFKGQGEEEKINLEVFVPTRSSDRQTRLNAVKSFLAQKFDLIHFACNVSYDKEDPSNSMIELTEGWRLKLSDIEHYEMMLNGSPIIIMNTCEAGNLDPQRVSGFAGTFLRYGARGVVATECYIPAVTAVFFTKNLYTRLLAGEPLGQSLLAVRQALWKTYRNPVGLLYSMYAPPSLSLARQDEQSPRPSAEQIAANNPVPASK